MLSNWRGFGAPWGRRAHIYIVPRTADPEGENAAGLHLIRLLDRPFVKLHQQAPRVGRQFENGIGTLFSEHGVITSSSTVHVVHLAHGLVDLFGRLEGIFNVLAVVRSPSCRRGLVQPDYFMEPIRVGRCITH